MRAVPAAVVVVMAEAAEAVGAAEADGRVHQRDGSETSMLESQACAFL